MAKNKGGRPPFKPTKDEINLVQSMAVGGMPNFSIAMCIRDGISINTLKKYFGDIIEISKAKAHAKLGVSMYQRALAGDNTMACFYGKTQMGWKETNVQELDVSDPLMQLLQAIDGKTRSIPND